MSDDLSRVALVTGGASGIGAAVVDLLLARGHRVGVLDLPRELPAATDHRLDVAADISDLDQVTTAVGQVVDAFGGLEIVVNCAGILTRGGVLDLDPADWRRTLDVNLSGAFHVMKAAAPHLRDAGWGRAVLVASIAGVTRVGQGNPAYAASKAGVVGLVRDLAAELGAWGVTVNAVAPGPVLSPMVSGNDAWQAAMAHVSPVGRISEPREMARVIGFLVSEDAAYITGTTLVADGGLSSGTPMPSAVPSAVPGAVPNATPAAAPV